MRRSTRPAIGTVGPLLLLGAAIVVCGCSKTATVTGKVTYQGRPVVHGSISLIIDAKTARSGVIQPDGSYSVENVPLGTMKIAVFSRDPSKGRSILQNQQPAFNGMQQTSSRKSPVEGWFPLPAKFEAVTTSGLTCTIDSRHVSHDIELK